MIETISGFVAKLKAQKPLVLCLTNFVSMDLTANTLLAIGAASIMSVAAQELEELISIANAIYINIGTLDENFIKRAITSAKLANSYKKPIILDPVGVGASFIRNKIALELAPYSQIIRGNASEIIALHKINSKTCGVESIHSTDQAKESAQILAKKYNNTIVVSGKIDFITNSLQSSESSFGSELMPFVTGMGCSLTAVIAAFHAIEKDSFTAAEIAISYFGLCGNIAQTKTNAPGSFRTVFIDELFKTDFEQMKKFIHI